MLNFNLTMDAASVLNCSPIDHRCSFTNCGKVICLRNRNHRHDLCSPSQKPHIISLSKSSTPRETYFARWQIFIIHTKNPPAHPRESPRRDLLKEHLTWGQGGITQANPRNSCHLSSRLIWKCRKQLHGYTA